MTIEPYQRQRPRVTVATAEPMPGWWNLSPRRPWFLTLACGHYVIRRALKAPGWVRCEGCA